MELSTQKFNLVNNLFQKVKHFVFPIICILCGNYTKTALSICSECSIDLPFITEACELCGIQLTTSGICGACLQTPPPYATTLAVFNYQYPIDKLISRLKFSGNLAVAHAIGEVMARTILPHLNSTNNRPDCIIPIPLHPKRIVERGFNQALEIARPITKATGIPIDFKSCYRKEPTQAQSLIPANERAKNIKNAFAIKKAINYRHVAILDDVVTTGSTVREFAKLLRKNGVEHIQVWCCARTRF